MTTVRTLSSEPYQGRAPETEGNARARALIRERFEAIQLQPVGASLEQPFTFTPRGRGTDGSPMREMTGVNLLARCPGTEARLPVIVLSAHYDHVGVRNGRMFPGADDNASGSAAILELAAQCMARRFRHDLVVAAFDAEEGGLNGARAFVASGLVPKERIAVNVNLDMVARGDKGEIYVAGTHYSPALRALLEPVASRAPIGLRFGHDLPGTGDDDWTLQSDHGEFHKAGVPFVYFGVEDHPDYHQPTDTADKINPDFFTKAVVVILDALRTLDQGLK
jgi:Zn-dependent M28 family amino/carboxypeptidase